MQPVEQKERQQQCGICQFWSSGCCSAGQAQQVRKSRKIITSQKMKSMLGPVNFGVFFWQCLVDCPEQTVDVFKKMVEIGRPSSIQIPFVARSHLLTSNIRSSIYP